MIDTGMLSRVADSLYWMARYLERAEHVARLLEVNLHLQLDLPLDGNQWQPIVETCGEAHVFQERYRVANEETVLSFLAKDRDYPNSIVSCLFAARENARSVRDTISSEVWEHLNSVYLRVQKEYAKPASEFSPETFRDLRLAGHMFQGITDATMSHNEAWHFVRLGRQMERADKTSRLLDVKYFMLLPSAEDVGTPFDELHRAAVLRSASALEMYRKKWGLIRPDRIIEFLLMDRVFPRSVFHCLQQAQRCLHMISNTPVGSYTHDAEQRLGALVARLSYLHPADIVSGGLHEFIDALQEQMNDVDRAIFDQYFAIRSAVAVPDSGFNAQPQQ